MKRREESDEVGDGVFAGKNWYWAKCGGFTTVPENAKVFRTYAESEVLRRKLAKDKVWVMCDPVPDKTIKAML